MGGERNTLIFDAEGVVIDTETVWDNANLEFFSRRGIRYHREEVKPKLSGRTLEESSVLLKQLYALDESAEALAAERLRTAYSLFEENVGYMSGFVEFFEEVEPDFNTCIATSLDPGLLRVVDSKLGLVSLFQGKVFTVAQAGASKPAPDVFLYAAGRLGALPDACIVIEDSPNGIEAARRASMSCVAVTTTYDPLLLCDATHIADSWVEVRRALSALSGVGEGMGSDSLRTVSEWTATRNEGKGSLWKSER